MQQRIDDLKFEALRNAIYHSSRRRFLDFLNRTLSFVVVASGSAALAALWYNPDCSLPLPLSQACCNWCLTSAGQLARTSSCNGDSTI